MQEHLSTYRDIIKKKVLGMDRKKDIINIIESTVENIKAAREISGQLDEIKIDAVTTFWRAIKKSEGIFDCLADPALRKDRGYVSFIHFSKTRITG